MPKFTELVSGGVRALTQAFGYRAFIDFALLPDDAGGEEGAATLFLFRTQHAPICKAFVHLVLGGPLGSGRCRDQDFHFTGEGNHWLKITPQVSCRVGAGAPGLVPRLGLQPF